MGWLDAIKDFFAGLFSWDDDEDELYSWSGDDGATWTMDAETMDEDIDDVVYRLVDTPVGEYVCTFGDIADVAEYVRGTPEHVLVVYMNATGEYDVYRNPSD